MRFQIYILSFFFCLIWVKTKAQEMQRGFDQLEKGQFEAAENFFANILVDYPENKTARLCYARAVGLHDDPARASLLFIELLEDVPGDLEVQLNYAESLLWNKEFKEAETYYKKLVLQHPENFGALLGFANTLSNLAKYRPALEMVNRALSVSPANLNALISRKYIRLGFASQYLEERRYQDALALLDKNLIDFPGDRETLLNKANIYLIQKDSDAAIKLYASMARNLNDSILAFNGIALASHISGDEKKALQYAKKSFDLSKGSTDSLRIFDAKERYVQALIWNSRYAEVNKYIKTLENEYGTQSRILFLKATLGMYTGDFKTSIINYKKILEVDSASFDGNLGIANAYFARGEARKAKMAADKTLTYYNNQQDAEHFLKKLDRHYSPVLEENLSYSFDSGNNEAYALRTGLRFPVSPNLEIQGGYTYRETKNTETNMAGTSNQFELAIAYRLSPVFRLKADGGFVKAISTDIDYTNLVGEFSLAINPFTRDNLEIGFRRDLQDFNAELLKRQIAGNHLFLNNNYATSYGLGWYLQYMHTEQSDENSRDLLFTSLYYSILKKPVLKTGLNIQYLTFEKQMPQLYFSPEKFTATEIFLNLFGNDSRSKLSYDVTAAGGYQYIEDQQAQPTYRFQAKANLQLGSAFTMGIIGDHSNIASATAAGFTYSQVGFNLKWFPARKPVFKLD